MDRHEGRRRFRNLIARSQGDFRLAEGALLIAQEAYPHLDINVYLQRLDEIGSTIKQRLGMELDPHRIVAAINTHLFDELNFRGNQDNYYDPRNSFLNEVLERKTGIPITLSVLYMEVGRRCGLAFDGVGFPGHFMVKTICAGDALVIDPFNGGEVKSREDLAAMLRQRYGDKLGFRSDFLMTVSKKQILQRMLYNLKAIYAHTNDLVKTLAVLDRLLILDPGSAEDIRDRGVIYARLECFGQAKDDFENYLRLDPDAPDAGAIRERLVELAKQVVRIH